MCTVVLDIYGYVLLILLFSKLIGQMSVAWPPNFYSHIDSSSTTVSSSVIEKRIPNFHEFLVWQKDRTNAPADFYSDIDSSSRPYTTIVDSLMSEP